jgi:hypothetical protein
VARRIRHNVPAPRRCEETVGDIDGDLLFALGHQSVEAVTFRRVRIAAS